MIARLCILALVAVWLNAQNPAPSDVNLWSKEKEAALGASLARDAQTDVGGNRFGSQRLHRTAWEADCG